MVILDWDSNRLRCRPETSRRGDGAGASLQNDDGYAERSRKLRLQIEELRAHLARLEAENRRFRTE